MNLERDFRHTAPLYSGRFHRAVQRGRMDILAAVEKGFAAISPGEYEAIEKKWLGYAIAELPYIRYASYALALLFFLGLTALLWNHLLRRQVARKTAQIEAMLKDLQESGEKLRTLSDNIAGGLVYRLEEDEEGRERRFSYISAGVRQLHEVDISESLNDPMTLYGQVLDEDRPLLAAREEAAKNSMSALSAEVRIRVPSGGIKWVTIIQRARLSAQPVGTASRSLITDRKRVRALGNPAASSERAGEPQERGDFRLDRHIEYRLMKPPPDHERYGGRHAIGKSMLEYISDSGVMLRRGVIFDRALSGESFT
jgi:PAS domain-containing protein